jgi:hypothetical protein
MWFITVHWCIFAFQLIIWLLCIILILEMISRYFDPVEVTHKQLLHSKSIHIIHHSCELGYVEPISPNWVEESETLIQLFSYCNQACAISAMSYNTLQELCWSVNSHILYSRVQWLLKLKVRHVFLYLEKISRTIWKRIFLYIKRFSFSLNQLVYPKVWQHIKENGRSL